MSTGGGAAAAPALAPVEAPKPRRRVAVWILLPVLALIVFWAVWQINEHGYYGAAANSQQAQPQPQPRLHTQTTGDKAFSVNAGGVYYYKLPVPAGAFNVNLKGHFSATGGSGNDIEVYVLTEDAYTNWQNGHSASTFYNSGRVTQDSVNLTLPSDAGTYYVLFNNKFSVLSPKAVQANLTLTYYTR